SRAGRRAAAGAAPSAASLRAATRAAASGVPPRSHAATRASTRRNGTGMIVATNLGKTYRSAGRTLSVLQDIDITIAPEEFVAIVGPSGSGKTTLLGLLAGLDTPTTGRVRLDGQELDALTEDQRAMFRAARVGFVFQT